MAADTEPSAPDKARFGIQGLDTILVGGLARRRLYLIEGNPGTGKTTVAMQFLLEGRNAGESGLYITLSETEEELRSSATSHGWSLEGINIYELAPPEDLLDDHQRQSLLYSSDLELGETARSIFVMVEQLKPSRVVLDSLSEIRLLAESSLRYRRQILALKHYFARQGATVLLLDDLSTGNPEQTVHSIAHGVLHLDELSPLYGANRRRLRITKMRGQNYQGGYHDFSIVAGGVVVFPRLVAAEQSLHILKTRCQSNISELDALLGGGLEGGTSTMFMGPSGCGKTLLALQFVASASRGGRAAGFLFDENVPLLTARAKKVGLDLEVLQASGRLSLQQVDPAELSPGEFAQCIRECVENEGVSTILIDSLNGYYAAMPEEHYLVLHMHELLNYLNRRGIVTIVTVAQHGLIGDMKSAADITYLSDTVVMIRFFEAGGRVRRALSVIKKRASSHEDSVRELRISHQGIQVGKPLTEFQGILRGIPEYVGKGSSQLLDIGK